MTRWPSSIAPSAMLIAPDRYFCMTRRICWPMIVGGKQYPLSSLLAALGRVQRQAPRVRIILCGLPTLTLNLKRARTYAERMFRHSVIANLERGDAWDALGIPLAGTGRTFALNPIGDIVEQTDGYPYFRRRLRRRGPADHDPGPGAALSREPGPPRTCGGLAMPTLACCWSLRL